MRVVLADDSMLLREGIARLLEEAGMEVVAQSGDAEDLLRKVGAHKPDVAIVDVRMPPTHTDEGLRAAAEIRDRFPKTGVLVLSQYIEESYAMELLGSHTEGVGYMLKDRVSDLDRFVEGVRRVGEGGSVLDPEVVSRLLGRRREADPLAEISPRERDVLGLMAEGRSNHAIADRARRHRARRREARHEHLQQAQPPADGRRPPPGARGADVPEGLIRRRDGVDGMSGAARGVRRWAPNGASSGTWRGRVALRTAFQATSPRRAASGTAPRGPSTATRTSASATLRT